MKIPCHAPLILQSAVLKNLRPNIRKTSGRLYLYQILKIIGVYLYSEYLVIHWLSDSCWLWLMEVRWLQAVYWDVVQLSTKPKGEIFCWSINDLKRAIVGCLKWTFSSIPSDKNKFCLFQGLGYICSYLLFSVSSCRNRSQIADSLALLLKFLGCWPFEKDFNQASIPEL